MPTQRAADQFNPASPTMAQDRYDILDAIRSEGPVVFVPSIGMWAVTGDDALREVLGDAARFPSGLGYRAPDHLPAAAFAVYPADGPIWKYALIGTDGELHRRLRGSMQTAFIGQELKAIEPLIAEDAAALVAAAFDDGEPADLYAKLARPLPSRTIARFFGLPVDDAPRFSEWSRGFITLQVPGLPEAAHVAAAGQFAEFDAYVRGIVAGDLSGVAPGIIRRFVEGAKSGAHDLTQDEMVGNIANVLFAGHETTVSTLSNMFVRVLQTPDLRAAIAEPGADADAIVRELLRLDTSVVGLFRYVAADTHIAGVPVPGGSAIWAAFGAANRDPAVYPRPDQFDPARPADKPPLTFGKGAHYCIGRSLAEKQIWIALKALVAGLPTARLAAPVIEVPNHLLRITPFIPIIR